MTKLSDDFDLNTVKNWWMAGCSCIRTRNGGCELDTKQESRRWNCFTNTPENHTFKCTKKWQDAHSPVLQLPPPAPERPTLGIRSQAAHCPASPWTRRDTYGDRSGSHWANLSSHQTHNQPTKPSMVVHLKCYISSQAHNEDSQATYVNSCPS